MMQISKEFAPPFKMIEPFFKYGSIFYIIAIASLLFINSNSNLVDFKIVGFAHLFLLGFVMIVIFGAMAQLIPVVLEVGHFSVDLYYIIFPTIFLGTITLVGGFWFVPALIPYGALLVFIAMAVFLFETLMTLKQTTTDNITVRSVKWGNYFLMAAIVVGFVMAVAIGNGLAVDISRLLPIHVVLVLLGYVTVTIIGLSMVLLPMFGLAHGYSDSDVENAFKLLVGSVVGFSVLKLIGLDFLANIALLASVVAVALYLKQLMTLYKIRARKLIDIWYKHIYTAFISLGVGAFFGIVGYYFNVENALKAALWIYVIGFFAFVINGHLLKIIPFLVWFERFSPLVGKKKVPMLHEMLNDKDSDYSFYLSLAGLVIGALGLLFGSDSLFKGATLLLVVGAFFMFRSVKYILNFKEEDYV